MTTLGQPLQIPLHQIAPDPAQPRTHAASDIEELTALVAARGVLQAITVVAWNDGTAPEGVLYRIRYGERRWHAAKQANLPTIPAVITDSAARPEDLLADQLAENDGREPLSIADRCQAYKRLAETMRPRDIAKLLGKDPAHVSRMLKIARMEGSGRTLLDAGLLRGENAAAAFSQLDPLTAKRLAKSAHRLGEPLTVTQISVAAKKAPSEKAPPEPPAATITAFDDLLGAAPRATPAGPEGPRYDLHLTLDELTQLAGIVLGAPVADRHKGEPDLLLQLLLNHLQPVAT